MTATAPARRFITVEIVSSVLKHGSWLLVDTDLIGMLRYDGDEEYLLILTEGRVYQITNQSAARLIDFLDRTYQSHDLRRDGAT